MSNLYEITYKNTSTSKKVFTRIALAVVKDGEEVILSSRIIGEMVGPWSQIR